MRKQKAKRTRQSIGSSRRSGTPETKRVHGAAAESDFLARLTTYELYVVRIAVFVLLVVGILHILCPEVANIWEMFAAGVLQTIEKKGAGNTEKRSKAAVRRDLGIDCAEFQHSHEIEKLVSSPPGYLGHRQTQRSITHEAPEDENGKAPPGELTNEELVEGTRRAAPEAAQRKFSPEFMNRFDKVLVVGTRIRVSTAVSPSFNGGTLGQGALCVV